MDAIDPTVREPSVDQLDTERLLANAARQASERGYDAFPIIDADCHHYETESFAKILDYIEDPVLRQIATRKQSGSAAVPGLLVSQLGLQDLGGRFTRYPLRGTETTPPTPHRDITLSRRWMDALGVDIACIFPTPMLSLGLHPQREVEVALARAYNRWLIETLLEAEPRLRSMLYLPLNDASASLRMVEEFGHCTGVVGFMVSSGRYMSVHDSEKMKVYGALQERGQRWPGKFGQVDRWNFCLRAARMPRNRRNHDETRAPDPYTRFQGQGGIGCHQGRKDAGRFGSAV